MLIIEIIHLKSLRYYIAIFINLGFFACANSQTEGLKNIRNASIYYKIIGKGEPIVILHGGPGFSHSYFLPQIEDLASKYQLIFYDQRASGKSSIQVSPQSISADSFVEDLETIRQTFGLEKMNLLGHSWGGFLAMRYAIKYPQHLKSLILVNTTPADKSFQKLADKRFNERMSKEDSIKRIKLLDECFQKGEAKTYEEFYRVSFQTTMADKSKIKDINFDLPQNFKYSRKIMANLGKDTTLRGYDLHPSLHIITCKTLIVYGEADVTPLEAQEKLQQHIPQSKLVVMKDCGHFPFVEKPKEFAAVIEQFLIGRE